MANQTPWYQYPLTLTFGQGDPGIGGEHGNDFDVPFHTTITMPASGTITSMNWDQWGGTITWKLDRAVNGVPYMYITHFDTFNTALQINGHYAAGTILGLSGGQIDGTGSHPTTSYWSGGPHIELGLAYGPAYGHGAGFTTDLATHPELDPADFVATLKGSGLASDFSSTFTSFFQSKQANLLSFSTIGAVNPLAANENVVGFFATLDSMMTIVNPFTFNAASVKQDPIGIGPVQVGSYTDPVAWLVLVGQNLGYDIYAIIIKIFFILLGFYICYKVASRVINLASVGRGVEAGIGGAANIGFAASGLELAAI